MIARSIRFFTIFSSLAILIVLSLFMTTTGFASDKPSFEKPASKEECKRLHDEIENDFIKANFCEKDEDCKAVTLGGWYIDFGCWKFVNTSINANAILDKIHKYKDELHCSGMINDCARHSKPACVEKKCAAKPIY